MVAMLLFFSLEKILCNFRNYVCCCVLTHASFVISRVNSFCGRICLTKIRKQCYVPNVSSVGRPCLVSYVHKLVNNM